MDDPAFPREPWFKGGHPWIPQHHVFGSYVGDEKLYRLLNPSCLYVEGGIVRDGPCLVCRVVDIPYFSCPV